MANNKDKNQLEFSMPFFTIYLMPFLSGLMLTLCFPDAGLDLLAFVALVPFFLSLKKATSLQAFYQGIIMGFIHYITLLYWVVPTLIHYGELSCLLAFAALMLLAFYLALYTGFFALFIKKIDSESVYYPFFQAALWTLLEFIRTYAFTGFPWGVLGYSQYENIYLIQAADLTGVLGISFFIVLTNGCLALIWQYCIKADRSEKGGILYLLPNLCLTLILLTGVMFYGRYRLQDIDHKIAKAPCVEIATVQGNISQDQKWEEVFKKETIDTYGSLSLSLFRNFSENGLQPRPDLVIWPETSLPFYYGYDKEESKKVNRIISEARSFFLVGSPAFDRKKGVIYYYNRAYMINGSNLEATSYYDKTHLVPFGEYIPLGRYCKFLGKLTSQAGDFFPGKEEYLPLFFNSSGKDDQVQYKAAVLICFEIIFPDISRQFVKNGADILTSITNDAWFGRSSAPAQHFSIGILRAVENRRSLIRAANTGISGFIDPAGRIIGQTELFQQQVLARSMPILTDKTLYTHFPWLVPLFALFVTGVAFIVKFSKKF